MEIDSEDVAILHLVSDTGVPVTIGLDYVARARTRNVEIIGEAANARLDLANGELTLTQPDGSVERHTDGFDTDAAYKLQFTELLASIESGTPTRIPLHEGLRATKIAIEAKGRTTSFESPSI